MPIPPPKCAVRSGPALRKASLEGGRWNAAREILSLAMAILELALDLGVGVQSCILLGEALQDMVGDETVSRTGLSHGSPLEVYDVLPAELLLHSAMNLAP